MKHSPSWNGESTYSESEIKRAMGSEIDTEQLLRKLQSNRGPEYEANVVYRDVTGVYWMMHHGEWKSFHGIARKPNFPLTKMMPEK